MKELIKSILGILLVDAISGLLGARYGRKTARKPVELIVVWDTTEVTVYDTITRYKPVYVTSYINDTIVTRLTTFDVPMERMAYAEDSLHHASAGGGMSL